MAFHPCTPPDLSPNGRPGVRPPASLGAPGAVASGGEGAVSGPLGSITKEPAALLGTPTTYDPKKPRAERFALRRLVADMLRAIGYKHRVSGCMSRLVDASQGVDVWRSLESGRASFGGVQVCGSVWACPVCSAKITERRVSELRAAIAAHEAAGGVLCFVTYTLAHSIAQPLAEVLGMLKTARSLMSANRAYKGIIKALGGLGNVVATEVTLGASGWHPHFHVLLFVSKLGATGADLYRVHLGLFSAWRRACEQAAIPDECLPRWRVVKGGRVHHPGCDFKVVGSDAGREIADYLASGLAKTAGDWDIAAEVARSGTKRARGGSYHPLDLAREFGLTGDVWCAARFAEYLEAFSAGRIAQLRWSRGLKRHFDLSEISDQNAAEHADSSVVLLASIGSQTWRIVRWSHAEAAVLDAAELGPGPLMRVLRRCVTLRMSEPRNRAVALMAMSELDHHSDRYGRRLATLAQAAD